MSAVTRRTPAELDRLVRLQQLGGWILSVGLVLLLVAAGGVWYMGGGPGALLAPQLLGTGPAFLLVILGTAAAALLCFLGMGLYLVVPGLDQALARRGFDSPATILTALAAVFALGNVLAVPALLGAASDQAQHGTALPASALVLALLATQLAIMAVLIWRIVRPGVITWEDMGLTFAHLDRRLLQGAVGGVMIFVLAALAGLAMRQLGVTQTQSQMFEGIRGVSQAQFLGFWLAAAVAAPICEELFFRGYVFSALRGRYGRLIAYPASAILFAAIHFNLPAIVPIMVMALSLAFLYDRSGSVVPGIVAHGLNNSVALTLLYAGLPT